jgi:hypothetical protein
MISFIFVGCRIEVHRCVEVVNVLATFILDYCFMMDLFCSFWVDGHLMVVFQGFFFGFVSGVALEGFRRRGLFKRWHR